MPAFRRGFLDIPPRRKKEVLKGGIWAEEVTHGLKERWAAEGGCRRDPRLCSVVGSGARKEPGAGGDRLQLWPWLCACPLAAGVVTRPLQPSPRSSTMAGCWHAWRDSGCPPSQAAIVTAIWVKNKRFLSSLYILWRGAFLCFKALKADMGWILWGFMRDVTWESPLGLLHQPFAEFLWEGRPFSTCRMPFLSDRGLNSFPASSSAPRWL